MADTITERLDRILYILPLAVRAGGVRLSELARALDCEPADVLRDLHEVTAREFHHPPGTTDEFQIFVEGDQVEVWTPSEFRQPARLNPREALALGIGLRMLAAEADAERRSQILELATRLERELVHEDDVVGVVRMPESARYALHEDAPSVAEFGQYPAPAASTFMSVDAGDDDFRADLADAAKDRERCRVLYLKPHAPEPVWRDIAPYLLVHASGTWYVVGHDASHDDLRTFRMDRMLRVERTGTMFDVPEDFDARSFIGDGPGVFRSPGSTQFVTVRYGPRIARWIEERTPCERAADGSVVVRHPVADPNWIVRHVLQYGADAEVVEPADVRERVAAAALRLSA